MATTSDRDRLPATWSEFLEVRLLGIALVEGHRWPKRRRARAFDDVAVSPEVWRLVALQLARWLAEDLGDARAAKWAVEHRREALEAYSMSAPDEIDGWGRRMKQGPPVAPESSEDGY